MITYIIIHLLTSCFCWFLYSKLEFEPYEEGEMSYFIGALIIPYLSLAYAIGVLFKPSKIFNHNTITKVKYEDYDLPEIGSTIYIIKDYNINNIKVDLIEISLNYNEKLSVKVNSTYIQNGRWFRTEEAAKLALQEKHYQKIDAL